jgi:citrate lyase subunit beta / citryl-CoA lyase
MSVSIAAARTFLFVPGDRPERFAKAAASGADVVVLDLEDAVAQDRKHAARGHVREWLGARHPSAVRVNAAGTLWHWDDIAMICGQHDAVTAVMVPKAEDAQRLAALSRELPAGMRIIPLIETAAGIARAVPLCAGPRWPDDRPPSRAPGPGAPCPGVSCRAGKAGAVVDGQEPARSVRDD